MNTVLTKQLEEVLSVPAERTGLAFGGPLRVAAATLSNSNGSINATTVVGVVGAEDIRSFEHVVAEIADEFHCDARIHLNVGSFSVRFTRQDS
jgi:hypothetical protein